MYQSISFRATISFLFVKNRLSYLKTAMKKVESNIFAINDS